MLTHSILLKITVLQACAGFLKYNYAKVSWSLTNSELTDVIVSLYSLKDTLILAFLQYSNWYFHLNCNSFMLYRTDKKFAFVNFDNVLG